MSKCAARVKFSKIPKFSLLLAQNLNDASYDSNFFTSVQRYVRNTPLICLMMTEDAYKIFQRHLKASVRQKRIFENLTLAAHLDIFCPNSLLANTCFQVLVKYFLRIFSHHPRYQGSSPNVALYASENIRVIRHTVWILGLEK